ncbi:hypothetical protein JW960_23560 [candidate division KSB1 bacterium]|nr:hypothetical protein [candidate division KSB1 bacterium]
MDNSRVKPSIFVFDFDGVICNSIYECFVSTTIAFGKFVNLTEDVPEFLRQHFEQFTRIRKYAAPIGEFYIIQCILHNLENASSYHDFLKLKDKYQRQCDEFRDIVFQTRAELFEKHRREWLAYHTFYTEVIDFIKIRLVNSFILTTKNHQAVIHLFDFIKLKFPEDRIISVAYGGTKKSKLEELTQQFSGRHIVFIDDHPLHLKDIIIPNVTCYLANWGYWAGDSSEFSDVNLNALSLHQLKGLI